MSTRPAAVIVLAAGEGTRMKSATPKVLHEIGGRSLIGHAVAAAGSLEPEILAIVVGHGRDQVTEHVTAIAPDVRIAVQDKQLGTGHAVACALEELPDLNGTVVVTYGDVPLLAAGTLREFVDRHEGSRYAVTVLTALLADPHGYGRIVRDERGNVAAIVEQKDASPEVQAIKEINSGIYAFDAGVLRDGLARLDTDNAQGELYLTDLIGLARADGLSVGGYEVADRWQTEGVNDRVQLAALGRELNRRVTEHCMRAGVTIIDPETTWIDVTVELEADVVLRPGTQLYGATSVAAGAQIGPDTTLRDCVVGAGANVVRAHGESSQIEAGADVGPYARMRPGTLVRAGGKVGTFVETKNATIGPSAKVPHLTYVGDATIGEGANIGAGTIFVNYDGLAKHHTTVGKGSFVGSNSSLVAPVDIADGAYVAAGSAVTDDVEPGEIAVARAKQRNIAGWVARKRSGTRTADAAAEAQAAGTRHTGDLRGEAGQAGGEGS
ncbi:MAG TPA: bifunctional UDP-N-acetylglucosamine diphosphorylase/glucosamine-1-phosphate N-acetyltransferase GlmU [Jiangellaceae bacterium]